MTDKKQERKYTEAEWRFIFGNEYYNKGKQAELKMVMEIIDKYEEVACYKNFDDNKVIIQVICKELKERLRKEDKSADTKSQKGCWKTFQYNTKKCGFHNDGLCDECLKEKTPNNLKGCGKDNKIKFKDGEGYAYF